MFGDQIRESLDISEAREFIEGLLEELRSPDPASIGQRIRTEVVESDESFIFLNSLITKEQLFTRQIDMHGSPMPLYKPDTLRRKKNKYPNWTAERYTYFDTGAFYREGIYMYADASSDTWIIQKVNNRDYFQYLMDDAVGLTEENFQIFTAYLDERVRKAQMQYFYEQVNERGYGRYFGRMLAGSL